MGAILVSHPCPTAMLRFPAAALLSVLFVSTGSAQSVPPMAAPDHYPEPVIVIHPEDLENLPVRGVATEAALHCYGGRRTPPLPPEQVVGEDATCTQRIRAWSQTGGALRHPSEHARSLARQIGRERVVPAAFENACQASAYLTDPDA